MSNKVKGISIKNHTHYFYNDIISMKSFDRNNIKIDEKLYKDIIIYYVRYVTIKDMKYAKINRVNPLYLIFNKINGFFEEIDKNKYLTLIRTNEPKKNLKK